jgi:DNA-binding response OmpR family regulator
VKRRRNILLVDDNIAVREALVNALETENYRVLSAGNGQEAVREFLNNPIDIALLDLNLGKESGWDVFERLTEIHPCLPTIVISAEPRKFAHRSAPAVNAFMEKPLNLSVLFSTLNLVVAESSRIVPAAKTSAFAEDCVIKNDI